MENPQEQIFNLLKNKYIMLYPDSFLKKIAEEIDSIYKKAQG